MMKYVALGDSITAYRENVKVYFEFLQEQFLREQKDGMFVTQMVNSGVKGWKSSDLLANLESACLRYDPDIVTVMIGTNDHAIYRGDDLPAVSVAEFEANLTEIVRTIRSGRTGGGDRHVPKVILMTPPFIATHTNVAGTKVSQARLMEYCRTVKKVSDRENTGFVDVNVITGNAAGWDDRTFFAKYTDRNDGVHLNSLGHSVIAPHIFRAVRTSAIELGRQNRHSP